MADDDQKIQDTQTPAEPAAEAPVEETPINQTAGGESAADEDQSLSEPGESTANEPSEEVTEEAGDGERGAPLSARSDSEDIERGSEPAGPAETEVTQEAKSQPKEEDKSEDEQPSEDTPAEDASTSSAEDAEKLTDTSNDDPNAKWYVVHTYSGHENKVATALKQRVESEHLEHKILDVLVPTQEKIEIRGGKKGTVKEKIFPGYILVKMILDDNSWLAVRTTQGVTSFVGIGNKPTPIPEAEVKTIVRFMTQGAAPTFKDVFLVNDTVKITDGPFSEFIGKVDSVDKEHGKVRVLVSIFGRETPVELDFLQVQKL